MGRGAEQQNQLGHTASITYDFFYDNAIQFFCFDIYVQHPLT